MSSAQQHLSQYNITVSEARDFILANISTPDVIYNTALNHGVTASMLAEIYGGVSSNDVINFFDSHNYLGHALNIDKSQPLRPFDPEKDENLFLFSIGDQQPETINIEEGDTQSIIFHFDSGGGRYVSPIKVIYGFEGSDVITHSDWKRPFLLGGAGDDSYFISNPSEYFTKYVIISDTKGNDTVYLPDSLGSMSFTIFDDTDLAMFNENIFTFLPNWERDKIENFILDNVNYTFEDISKAVEEKALTVTLDQFIDLREQYKNDENIAAFKGVVGLVDYLSGINEDNIEYALPFDITEAVGVQSLIEYIGL